MGSSPLQLAQESRIYTAFDSGGDWESLRSIVGKISVHWPDRFTPSALPSVLEELQFAALALSAEHRSCRSLDSSVLMGYGLFEKN
jgi:hypothetical protein